VREAARGAAPKRKRDAQVPRRRRRHANRWSLDRRG